MKRKCGCCKKLAKLSLRDLPRVDNGPECRDARCRDQDSDLGTDQFCKRILSLRPEQNGRWRRSYYPAEFFALRGVLRLRRVVRGEVWGDSDRSGTSFPLESRAPAT